MYAKQQRDEAILEFRKAIELDPKQAEAHCNLGLALRDTGELTESLNAYRTGHRLGSAQPGWRYPSAQWVREAERLVALDKKLPAVLERREKPDDDAERFALARFCQQPFKKLYAASFRFFADAFADDPKLADDLKTCESLQRRLLRCAGRPPARERTTRRRMRRKKRTCAARRWNGCGPTLRHGQGGWRATSFGGSESGSGRRMRQWQEDADLSGLRDPAGLAKLPAEEQEACKKLWADVQALLDKAEAKK